VKRIPTYTGPRPVRQAKRRHKYGAAHRRLRQWALHHIPPQCVACGFDGETSRLHLDHVDPDGDRFDPRNLQWLCHHCHSRKTATESLGIVSQT